MKKAIMFYSKYIFDEGGNGTGADGAQETGAGTGGTNGTGAGTGGAQGGESQDGAADPADEKKYSDKDLDEIIGKKFAQWQKKQAKAVDEAKKYEQMTAEEKQQARLNELQQRIDEMEAKETRGKMAASVRKTLNDEGVIVDDTIVDALIRKDAEETKTAVTAFLESFKKAVTQAAKTAYGRKAPAAGSGPTGMTREQIMKIADPIERQKAIRENMDAFKN